MNLRSPAKSLANAAESILVGLARNGDQAAFAELVRRRQSHLRNLLRRLCRDGVLADDLAQDAFLQAWKQVGTLRSISAFGTWLRQIAITSWLQHARRSETFTDLEHADDAHTLPTHMMKLDLDSALSRLPPPVRACIVLSYHEGMSHAEIATIVRLPLGTVKSHIARGTVRLRELLAAYNVLVENHACTTHP